LDLSVAVIIELVEDGAAEGSRCLAYLGGAFPAVDEFVEVVRTADD